MESYFGKTNLPRQILFASVIVLFFSSCGKSYKPYKYVEQISKCNYGSVYLDEYEKVINAESDSAAYLLAYEMFCKNLRIRDSIKSSIGSDSICPIAFKVFDNKGTDISYVKFISKKEIETDIAKKYHRERPDNWWLSLGKWNIRLYVDKYREYTKDMYIYQEVPCSYKDDYNYRGKCTAVIYLECNEIGLDNAYIEFHKNGQTMQLDKLCELTLHVKDGIDEEHKFETILH